MVQGLGFLSKKSWHTKNKANQEKVWIAEQKKEQETAKAKELAREIQEERERDEFDKIAGKKSAKDKGIDWMYQNGTSTELAKEDAAKKAEEYLLGKEYVGEGAIQGDFHDGNQNEGIHSALTKTESVSQQEPRRGEIDSSVAKYQANDSAFDLDPNSVKYRNENFTMSVEDPMFYVSQKEREKKEKREKTTALYNRIVGPTGDNENSSEESSSSGESRKRSKKDRKRHKKKKKRKSSRSRRDRDSREGRNHRSQRGHRRRTRSRSRSSSTSRSRNRSRSRSNDRRQRYSGNNNGGRRYGYASDDSYDSRHERYRNSRTMSRREYDRDRREYDRDRREYDRGRRSRSTRDDNSYIGASVKNTDKPVSNRKNDDRPKKLDGYGLKGASSQSFGTQDIGPSADLIRKKKEEERNQRNRNFQISKSRRKMTKEERAEALQQMQVDARKRGDRMSQTASNRTQDNDYGVGLSSNRGASFLNDITSEVNGITSIEQSTLSSRVAQNRHTNQRLHDSFL